METTLTTDEQKLRATLQSEDVFARAGVTLPDEPAERQAYFDLVEAAATMASEQLVGKVQEARDVAQRAADEMQKLRGAVLKYRNYAQATANKCQADLARAQQAADKRVRESELKQAELNERLLGKQADEADAAAQSAALTSEDLSILVGQTT